MQRIHIFNGSSVGIDDIDDSSDISRGRRGGSRSGKKAISGQLSAFSL